MYSTAPADRANLFNDFNIVDELIPVNVKDGAEVLLIEPFKVLDVVPVND